MNASSQASDELVVNAAVVRCEQEERVGVTPNATTIEPPSTLERRLLSAVAMRWRQRICPLSCLCRPIVIVVGAFPACNRSIARLADRLSWDARRLWSVWRQVRP